MRVAISEHPWMAAFGNDIDSALKAHFADKLARIKGLKGVAPGTQAALVTGLPELGRLSHKKIAKVVGVAPCHTTAARRRQAHNVGRASPPPRRGGLCATA